MQKKRNILLVYPEVPGNTYWSFKYALRFIRKKSAHLPLGLISVAALFPKDYCLKLVDLNIEQLREDDIHWADAVFISAMLVQQASAARVATIFRRHGKPVVLGGPYANSSWQEIDGVDHIILGEVEDSFHAFLSDFESGVAQPVYPAPPRPDISRIPIPRFDLLNMDAYASMSIQYSRGCPFKCEFCDIWRVYGNRPRLKTPRQVTDELDTLYRLGWRGSVFVVDDNFIGSKRRVKKEFLPALMRWQIAHNHVFRFFTEASINLADDEELMAGMRDAGFNEVFVGIETPSPDCLREAGKVQNLKIDLMMAVRRIQAFGIEVMAGFILGFDSDSEDIFDRQIDFIQQAGIPKAMVGLLTALPGTDLYRRLEQEGRITTQSDGNNTHCMNLNFRPVMDLQKLRAGYQKVLSTLYDANLKNYFARCSQLLENLGAAPYFQREIHWKEIVMLLKSIVFQPFKPYGFQYLKFIAVNGLRHRHLFAEVIAYSIVGHHFHTITQESLKIERLTAWLDDCYRALNEQVAACSRSVSENSRETLERLEILWQERGRVLRRYKDAMDRIHKDFRADLRIKYDDMVCKTQDLFASHGYVLPG